MPTVNPPASPRFPIVSCLANSQPILAGLSGTMRLEGRGWKHRPISFSRFKGRPQAEPRALGELEHALAPHVALGRSAGVCHDACMMPLPKPPNFWRFDSPRNQRSYLGRGERVRKVAHMFHFPSGSWCQSYVSWAMPMLKRDNLQKAATLLPTPSLGKGTCLDP